MALGFFWASICLLVFLAILSLDIMGFFSNTNKFPVEGRTVLLTGGSQGMGLEAAKLLAKKGANIIIVARNPENLASALEAVKASAKNPTTQRFLIISADVSSETENLRILSESTTWNNGQVPEIVWAVAGGAIPGLFLETSVDTMKKQMDLNYWATVYLAHATLKEWLYPSIPYPALEPNDRGKVKSELPRHFIITSSAVAFYNVVGYGPYGMAKTALRSLADTLRNEILLYNGARRSNTNTKQNPPPFDIQIQAIYPGTISSPGLERENSYKHEVTHIVEASDPVQTPLEAATAAINGLEKGNYMTSTNWLGKLMRMTALGGVPRDNLVIDTLGQWLTSIIMLFVVPDIESKVWNWGKKNGMPASSGTN